MSETKRGSVKEASISAAYDKKKGCVGLSAKKMFYRKMWLCMMVCCLFLALPTQQAFAVGPSTPATKAYLVMDADSGQVLVSKNPNEQHDPASITKVLTLGLACQKAQGNWDTQLTVSHEDVYSLYNTGSSHIALQEGEVITLRDALYSVVMVSANDSANVLASYIGGDIAGGVAAMNAQVAALGLTNTHFTNPHGLDEPEHKTSAYDMAQILRWALMQPGFSTLFSNRDVYTMQPTNKQEDLRYFSLQDNMRVGGSRYYVPEITGSKTGYTDVSRFTYISLAEQDGKRLICVTLFSQEKTDRYADVATLYEYAFGEFVKVDIPSGGEQIPVTVMSGGNILGEAYATEAGLPVYLYKGQGAEQAVRRYDAPKEYVVGTPYFATAHYSFEATAYQEAIALTIPMEISGVQAVLQANTGIALVTAADIAPEKPVNMTWFILGGVCLVAAFIWLRALFAARRRAKRRKRRRKQLHK